MVRSMYSLLSLPIISRTLPEGRAGVGVALGAVSEVGVADEVVMEVGVADEVVVEVGVADVVTEGVTEVGVAFPLDLVGLGGGSRGLGTGLAVLLELGKLFVLVVETFLKASSPDATLSSLELSLPAELAAETFRSSGGGTWPLAMVGLSFATWSRLGVDLLRLASLPPRPSPL